METNNKELEIKTVDEVIGDITESLREADGKWIEKIANMVLTQKHTYLKDSTFKVEDVE